MLTLKVQRHPQIGSHDWEWAVLNGQVKELEGVKVALLGAADYVVDPDHPTRLLSINGVYMDGIRKHDDTLRSRGVRWVIDTRPDGGWLIPGDDLSRIAIELLLGVVTDPDGRPMV